MPPENGTNGVEQSFRTWIEQSLKPRAMGRMIAPDLFDSVLAQAEFQKEVVERQSNQTEFIVPIWEYLDIVATEDRIRNGRQALRRNRSLFIEIERRFGVEPVIIAAIWGVETGFGTNMGDYHVISALASLAFWGRRASFFEDELIGALRILQAGHIDAANMTGSWSGAMGHGQFMPTSFLDFAVDHDGDQRADIWGTAPDDALASIANFLRKHGWRQGQPWGCEIVLPDDFDFGLSGLDYLLTTKELHNLGVTLPGGGRLPDYGSGSILLPGGAQGVALLVLRNFHVIMRYNRSEAYAIGIGHLSDRIVGGGVFNASWPLDDPMLSRDEVSELQVRLSKLGFDTHGADGIRGPNTTRAARAFQQEQGLDPDGFMTVNLLERLRHMGR
ncbi:lytic murein transglycosylase [Maritimibacter dapengensis]|uniref:Lytic murein transglycosylase n=1 Tax=Maritimibacter dapengensis TaxID=2836868 RepID=A0ABS6T5S7_9RHOB|nr:lytic murein transglycosylase [Maritimibacter dapengensis]MBV7379876.1 lytic murein transglycosylase [Maritimibacter dapengensis]